MSKQQKQAKDRSLYQAFAEYLSAQLRAEQIITHEANRLAYGTDASFYRLIPQLVLRLDTLEEVQFVVRACAQYQLPYTFRAAGTSLSGQAVSDSILITLSDAWRGHQMGENGDTITLQPGVIGAEANRLLAPFQRKIGPDPASINTCKIGGIAANNASGMCCGTAQNSYRTVAGMKVVLHDGTLVDTQNEASISAFRQSHHTLLSGLQDLRENIVNNQILKDKIIHKYRLKNTTGYALNALVDFDDPLDIFTHLMIGSEGTLGFIAEITYHTVVDHPYKASALLVFDQIETASKAVTQLSQTAVAAVELMDGRALRSVANAPGMPDFIQTLPLDAAALLVESHASDQNQLNLQCKSILALLAEFSIAHQIPFTQDPNTINTLWGIRKGMFPAVGAVRSVGTTVIIEDVAFPVERLAQGVRDLQQLFHKYAYHEAIIFGHALEGNLHFVFTQGFDKTEEIERYSQFMDDVTDLVAVKYQGSLKAEHGTGRNMAPYVELEWGKDAYAIMKQIKALFDPRGLLNPGVIINDDPRAHLNDLKPMPAADPLVDPCIECGFCEPVCPSRTLTLSPRQRIVLYRELQRRQRASLSGEELPVEELPIEELPIEQLKAAFDYQGIETCAATGLCAERCPVGINTGDLIKQLRQEKYRKYTRIATWSAHHFATSTRFAKIGLKANQWATQRLGEASMEKWMDRLRSATLQTTPKWYREYPTANRHRLKSPVGNPEDNKSKHRVVYLPSCASQIMGASAQSQDQRSTTEVTMSLLTKAGYQVIIPNALSSQCCGMPYESKGFDDIALTKAQQLESALWEATEQGALPVLCDTSPCVKRSKEQFSKPIAIYEPSEFVSRFLLDKLSITPLQEPVMLHVTCSSRRLGLAPTMLKLAQYCTDEVILAEDIQCCGWAGDKGFTTPELNQAALADLKSHVPSNCTRGYSNSRTCEIGLSHHSGIDYQSILYLVDEVAEPKQR